MSAHGNGGRCEDIEIEDMIADEDMAITISNKGYASAVEWWVRHKNAAAGRHGHDHLRGNFVERMFVIFEDFYDLSNMESALAKVYEIPVFSESRGKAIVIIIC